MSLASNAVTTLAAIAWDPEIRGVLIVVTAVAILVGSTYLLLATNVGSRLGFLVAMGGLFGWMTLMGIFWWVYGIGPTGDIPEWRVQEINVGNTAEAQIEEVRDLVAPDDLPEAAAIIAADAAIAEQVDPEAEPSLSELATLAPETLDSYDYGGDWAILAAADLGEPQAAADAALTEGDAALFETTEAYLTLEGFETGGKPERDGDSLADRLSTHLENTLTLTHPEHYAVVQVQAVVPQETEPGEAPPTPVADEGEPVISVIMIRDLGNRRLPPALFTISMAILFALTCWRLHERDKQLWRMQAEGTAAPSA